MLNQLEPEEILRTVPGFKDGAMRASRGLHGWILRGGEERREAADVLHGIWLGHPLHPVLTDITIGAWILGCVLDLLSLAGRSRGVEKAADTLIGLGNLSAIGTAAAGLTDFSTIPQSAVSTGAVHGLLNAGGLALNLLSSFHRASGQRGRGIRLTLLSQAVLLVSGWMGGELVYRYKSGVNRIPAANGPQDWQAALEEADLPERTPKRVLINGAPVLLYRYQGQVYAIGAVCGHEGGPLDEGEFEGFCVTCPWHQSVYDLRDGSVVHGPTTYVEPSYEARVYGGMIELRLREPTATAKAREIAAQVVEHAKGEK